MIEVGRVCLKIAGRDSGRYCVIVESAGHNTVLIDGQTRRKKCNVKHIEPTTRTVEIPKGASHSEVIKALDAIGIKTEETIKKQKQPKSSKKPSRSREAKPEKKPKKESKKESKKEAKAQ